jgi:flagella basal body P-ring formation protein FlgA
MKPRKSLLTAVLLIRFLICLLLLSFSDFKASFASNEAKAIQSSVVCSSRAVKKGEKLCESNLLQTLVPTSECPADRIVTMDYVLDRKADRQFPPKHVFTLTDLGLPAKPWPTGDALIVYALKDIPKGHVIRISDIAQGKWTKPGYMQGAFSDPNLVLNRPAAWHINKGVVLILPAVGLGIGRELRKRERTTPQSD